MNEQQQPAIPEAPHSLPREQVMAKRNRVQAEAMRQMLGLSLADALGSAPSTIEKTLAWTSRYAAPFSDLFKNDETFRRTVLKEEIEAVIRQLKEADQKRSS